jgi:hypothetical protein
MANVEKWQRKKENEIIIGENQWRRRKHHISNMANNIGENIS